jgi:hypothetical protein
MPQSGRQDPNVQPDDIMRVISCFRSHGLPDYPDPAYDRRDGRWHYPDNAPTTSAQIRQACASVMPQATPPSPIPTGQLNDLLDFAKCMRAHGLPQWPDPNVGGAFPFAAPPDKADPAFRSAVDACQPSLVSSGGSISLVQPNG